MILMMIQPIQYGMPLWRNLFNFRQLLCHGTGVEVFRELLKVFFKKKLKEH